MHTAHTAHAAHIDQQLWRQRIQDVNEAHDIDALEETCQSLFSFVHANGFEAVDLRGFEAARVNGVHLAMVLRITFSRKDAISGWEQALDAAKAALERDDLDPQDALLGLI